MNNTLNKSKLLATISNSANGELFDALFAGDTERTNGNAKAAARSVINTLAWYLSGDVDSVTAVFADSPLASQVENAAALILKACSEKKGVFAGSFQFYGDDKEYEKPARKGDGSEKLKISHVEKWLEENGVSVRFNIITQAPEISGYTARSLQKGNLLNTLPTVIYNDIVDEYKGVTQELIYSYLRVIIEAHSYNPVLDKLATVEWDGTDRWSEVWKMIGLEEDTPENEFSRTLFQKWMLQSLCMLHNGEDDYTFGADGVLTLSGPQGIGKTTLLRSMAMDRNFFRESQRLDDKDKDTARRCVTTWIAELGELDCTLKSDLGYLKGFITADIDSYRLPYGRSDVTVPRHSSLAATVNGDSYLIDPTGNRRYWTLPLKHIDIEAVMSYNWVQVWKQVEHMINASPLDVSQVFRLTKEEQKDLENRNRGVEKGLPGEAEIADIFAAATDTSTWEYMTTTRFKDCFPVLRGYTVKAIGAVLKKKGIARKSKKIDGMPVYCYLLPKETSVYIAGLEKDEEEKAPEYSKVEMLDGEDENIPF